MWVSELIVKPKLMDEEEKEKKAKEADGGIKQVTKFHDPLS